MAGIVLSRDGIPGFERRLDALLEALLRRPGVAHAVMAVENTEGSWGWSAAAGTADASGRAMQVHTPFFIASIDKLFTSAVVLKLCESGRLRLEDRIVGVLPERLVGGLHRMGGVDYTGSITVLHLLGHTSGLACYLEDAPRGGTSLIERLVTGGDRALGAEQALAEVRDRLRPHFPPQAPGPGRTRVRYSDTNYRLLGLLVEAITGEPLHRVFERMLFAPAGMRQTWLPGWSEPLEPAPEPAGLWFGARPVHLPLALASLPSVYSTTADLLAFIRALVSGALFECSATGALMQSHWKRLAFPRDRAALRAPGWPIDYGLGMMRFQLPPVLTGLRRLPPVLGHTGSTGSWLFHCPDLDLVLCGTVDQGTAGAVPYRWVPRILRAASDAGLKQPGRRDDRPQERPLR